MNCQVIIRKTSSTALWIISYRALIAIFLMWQLVALLVYADSGNAVEKPKDDAEAPLLTTFDGVEFPSTERPIKLIHGRASFKLKISQVC